MKNLRKKQQEKKRQEEEQQNEMTKGGESNVGYSQKDSFPEQDPQDRKFDRNSFLRPTQIN